MTSQLAMGDIERLQQEGCTIPPADVVRLNALGLKIEKKPDFRLSTLPRVALCNDILFVEPTIEQDIFLDTVSQIFSRDAGTVLALQAYILSHPDEDFSKRPMFPVMFAAKCAKWIKKNFGKVTATKLQAVIDYCRHGMNPLDGEYPVYMVDETFEKWYGATGPKSSSLKEYLRACTFGIPSEAALKATSPQLTAMIERAFLLNDRNISDEEKLATGQYYATLESIKSDAYARRDAEREDKPSGVDNGKSENPD